MGVVKAAMGDMVVTFLWVFLSATFGLQTSGIISATGIQGYAYAPLMIITLLVFVYVSIFTVIGAFLGGAGFNPTGNAAFVAAGVSHESLFSIAIRSPAQAIGAAGGALAVLELIPTQYKHMIGGPSLKVDMLTGAIVEGLLSFLITFAVLLIILKGPKKLLAKTFLLAVSTVSLLVAGSKYTGPAMNPAIAFGWAYVNKTHNTWEHFNTYWISSFNGAIFAGLVFRVIFPPPPAPKQKKA